MQVVTTKANQASLSGVLTLKGKDIVIIGLQPWYYNIGSNCKDIAVRLAKNNRVLFVNKPLNRKTWVSRNKDEGVQLHCDVITNKLEPVEAIQKNMWHFFPESIIESINWLPSTALFKRINYINNKRFAKDLKTAIKELGFKDIILFNDNDIFNGYYLKELLSPSLYIYYCRDYLRGYDYWKKHCDILEPELIKKADVVVTNSEYYATYCGRYNKASYYIGQGCNTNLFNANRNYLIPCDIKSITYPVIGYTGALDLERLDESIIAAIAKKYSKANIVLIGPQLDNFLNSKLHQYGNIYFLGRKALDDLPAYIKAFDVCINPQVKNEITKGNYPLKIDEYLSMGKPVVATRTEAMRMFEHYTYLSDSPDEFTNLIEKALTEDSEQLKKDRIHFAGSHTWEKCIETLSSIIHKHLS